MNNIKTIDTAGFVISSLCVAHCLLLPFIALFLPIMGSLSEVEWIHKLLVIVAILLFISLIFRSNKTYIVLPATLGITCLLAGAFVESLHDYETMLTVIGASFLGLAHLTNLRMIRHRP